MKFQVMMEFDQDVLPALRKTPEEVVSEIRFLAAARQAVAQSGSDISSAAGSRSHRMSSPDPVWERGF